MLSWPFRRELSLFYRLMFWVWVGLGWDFDVLIHDLCNLKVYILTTFFLFKVKSKGNIYFRLIKLFF
jgi:hypothetical protein